VQIDEPQYRHESGEVQHLSRLAWETFAHPGNPTLGNRDVAAAIDPIAGVNHTSNDWEQIPCYPVVFSAKTSRDPSRVNDAFGDG
jgi:hypothetical protein